MSLNSSEPLLEKALSPKVQGEVHVCDLMAKFSEVLSKLYADNRVDLTRTGFQNYKR